MKWIIVVGDGMGDYPLEELDYKTPLEVAHKPNMDSLATKGRLGILKTIPDNNSNNAKLTELIICTNSPLAPPVKEDIDDYIKFNLSYEYKSWQR